MNKYHLHTSEAYFGSVAQYFERISSYIIVHLQVSFFITELNWEIENRLDIAKPYENEEVLINIW